MRLINIHKRSELESKYNKGSWNKIRSLGIFGIGFVFFGFAFGMIIRERYEYTSWKQSVRSSIGPDKTENNLPVRMIIPSLSLNLPIRETSYENNTWDIPKFEIGHWVRSTNPDNQGNGIYYGHNSKEVFQRLVKIQKTADIYITTGNNKQYIYRVRDIRTVKSTDIQHVLATVNHREQISVFTCAGLFDTKRFVVTADRVSEPHFASRI